MGEIKEPGMGNIRDSLLRYYCSLLIGLFIHGGAWLSAKIYPFLTVIFGITFGIALFILTPISIFKRARRIAGNGIVISSFIFGLTLWVWSFLLTYTLWGGVGIFIGLFLFGVGVVPIAMLATLFKGMWAVFGQLMFLTILTFGSRFFGVFLLKVMIVLKQSETTIMKSKIMALLMRILNNINEVPFNNLFQPTAKGGG